MKKKIEDYTADFTGNIQVPMKYKQLLGFLEIRESNAEKYMVEHNGWFFCSQKEMCEATGIPERTVNRLLKAFVKEGLLLRQSGHRGLASEYKITYCHGVSSESGRLDKITTMADQDCQNHCNYTDEEIVIEKVADQDCQVNKGGRPFTLSTSSIDKSISEENTNVAKLKASIDVGYNRDGAYIAPCEQSESNLKQKTNVSAIASCESSRVENDASLLLNFLISFCDAEDVEDAKCTYIRNMKGDAQLAPYKANIDELVARIATFKGFKSK